jgi:hypothetical protein
VRRREGVNTVTVGNALDLLTRRGALEAQAGKDGRRYVRGPAHEDLAALRERLGSALLVR